MDLKKIDFSNKDLKKEFLNFLDRNDYNWITVYIDFVNLEISIFDICSGLDESRDLTDGDIEHLKENPNEVSYVELQGTELQNLNISEGFDIWISETALQRN